MTARRVALAMAAAFTVYAVLVAWRGWDFLRSGEPAAIGLGVAVLVLPALAGYLVWREVRFGYRMQELGDAAGEPPTADLDVLRAAVDATPEDWRAWYFAGLAYFDAGDRTQARAALEHAWRVRRDG